MTSSFDDDDDEVGTARFNTRSTKCDEGGEDDVSRIPLFGEIQSANLKNGLEVSGEIIGVAEESDRIGDVIVF